MPREPLQSRVHQIRGQALRLDTLGVHQRAEALSSRPDRMGDLLRQIAALHRHAYSASIFPGFMMFFGPIQNG